MGMKILLLSGMVSSAHSRLVVHNRRHALLTQGSAQAQADEKEPWPGSKPESCKHTAETSPYLHFNR